MDFKKLKKLAEFCRKNGIQHFKDAEFEFTLSNSAPAATAKKSRKDLASIQESIIPNDSLSEEAILFWSVAGEESSE